MQRLLAYKSSQEHYKADACVVWCFDDRFSGLLEEMRRNFKLDRIDQVEVAGGAKELADSGASTEFILDQIGKSIKLHHTPLVVLMIHKECGAYGKLEVPDEAEFLTGELKKAGDRVRQFLKDKGYRAEVKSYLADFDGLWEVK